MIERSHAQLPLERAIRHRSISLDVFMDDAAAERLCAELLALARRVDGRASACVKDAASLPWTELSFVAIDVETTGFRAGIDRVIEVGWVRFEQGREVERFSSLIHVHAHIPDPVRALTGITPAMLAGKPSFADIAPGLVDVLARADFAVAYNASFDRGFLAAELALAGRALPSVPFIDPLVFVRDLDAGNRFGSSGHHRLDDAARRFGITRTGAHRAENDARTTGQLLLKLAPRLGANSLKELVDKQERWARVPVPEEEPSAPESTASSPSSPPSIGARILSLFR